MPQFVVPPEGISFKDVITDFEKRLIESTLEAAGGVQKRAAELLHIKPTTLNEMIKRYDIAARKRHTNGDELIDGTMTNHLVNAVLQAPRTKHHAGSCLRVSPRENALAFPTPRPTEFLRT